MINSNHLYSLKKCLKEKFKIDLGVFVLKTLQIPMIFYIILSYLDDETIFEAKYVASKLKKLIEKNIIYDNKSMKIEIKRLRRKIVSLM
jgi:hypothetical protein